MNIKRGMFRLWLVFSVLWIASMTVIWWPDIQRDTWTIGDRWWEADALANLPVRCEYARGAINADYRIGVAAEPWNQHRAPSQACWYSEKRFRALWPEYADLDHASLSNKLYQSLGWTPQIEEDRFERTKRAMFFAFIPPILLLAIGSALFWALSGFSRPKGT
ncbi:hypothetical protein [Ensifer sp. Root558]|uniref:hypothetical protein n=1 Tax=Ensifer sp. Root558 TaxID=1736558 RepID=UPI0007146052|nr:hypothetical protein [Ensifer sp. Root558]KQZ47447.1 hypothetical protein ASD63_31880 [Ensifer sp. Root558]